MKYAKELSTSLNLVSKTGELQQKAIVQTITHEKKGDASPVTDVDRECEKLIRDNLLETFPSDGFLGEESGIVTGQNGRRWIVDPLDGTRPFLRGIPTYSTLVALEENDIPVVGVIHLPALGITCWASNGNGAFINGRPATMSSISSLGDALGSALGFLEHPSAERREQLLTLMQSWNYAYGFMDAFSYVCLAEGKLDCCVNLLDKPWDCAAAACIITEAGGIFTDIQGEKSIHNGSIVLSNRHLHRQILEYFEN
jgi:histidinol phosphatase-like enzyme (inositol monophosphatase family)